MTTIINKQEFVNRLLNFVEYDLHLENNVSKITKIFYEELELALTLGMYKREVLSIITIGLTSYLKHNIQDYQEIMQLINIMKSL
jgi:hypothetical protein